VPILYCCLLWFNWQQRAKERYTYFGREPQWLALRMNAVISTFENIYYFSKGKTTIIADM